MKRMPAFLALFSSVGTLLCCALPALLVLLGFGSVVAATVGAVPGIVILSEYKIVAFSVAGILIFCGLVMHIRSGEPDSDESCPIDPGQRAACMFGKRASRVVLISAIVLYTVGVSVAFILPRFLE